MGEIGGDDEERAATYIHEHMSKPVSAFIAGKTAPSERQMGHAGAIIGGEDDTARAKMDTLRKCGITVSDSPASIGAAMADVLSKGVTLNIE